MAGLGRIVEPFPTSRLATISILMQVSSVFQTSSPGLVLKADAVPSPALPVPRSQPPQPQNSVCARPNFNRSPYPCLKKTLRWRPPTHLTYPTAHNQ
jgi:hypothetical protein